MLAPARSRKKAPRLRPRIETFTWESADNPAVDRAMLEHARRTMPDWAFAREWKGNPQRRAFERGDIKGQVRKEGLYVDEHGAKTRASVAKGWASESKNRFVEKIKAVLAKKGKKA